MADVVELAITDSGTGIAPEFLSHVFEPFRQAESSASRRFGGLGLGLSIVRQIVDLHGGSVVAESRGVGLGARFVVRLPVAESSAAATPIQTVVTCGVLYFGWIFANDWGRRPSRAIEKKIRACPY